MMKKRFWSITLSVCIFGAAVFLPGCKDNKSDESSFDYTRNNLYAVDLLGRQFMPVDNMSDEKEVGLFYMIWHGQHGITSEPYDITKLLETDPDALWDINGRPNSPVNALHYWGEPLYGYYNMQDEWVVRRHMEMLSLAGVDYLGLDVTNIETYDEAWLVICQVLQEMQDDGIDAPKIVFYCNTFSEPAYLRVIHFYDVLYSVGRFKDVWYQPNGKPVIIAIKAELERNRPDLLEFFDVRASQWPGYAHMEDGVPWMSFTRPQEVIGNAASVSVAQQLQRFSEAYPTAPNYRENASWGRGYTTASGFDYDYSRNYWGDNFQEEWDFVIGNDAVDRVFVTSFNEWVAQKIITPGVNCVTFTDCFNLEYSRDIEPMKGGYNDNYLLQFADNIRRFKGNERKKINVNNRTIDLDKDLSQWDGVNAFRDPRGDAMERNHIGSWNTVYTDKSNRNDIISTQIAHDDNYLYINVEVAYELIMSDDPSWMNVYINVLDDTDAGFAGYNYILNRSRDLNSGRTKLQKFGADNTLSSGTDCVIKVYDNNVVYRIPLADLGYEGKAPKIAIKVTDNIQNFDDPMDFYVSGDSAPLGLFSYGYGI